MLLKDKAKEQCQHYSYTDKTVSLVDCHQTVRKESKTKSPDLFVAFLCPSSYYHSQIVLLHGEYLSVDPLATLTNSKAHKGPPSHPLFSSKLTFKEEVIKSSVKFPLDVNILIVCYSKVIFI